MFNKHRLSSRYDDDSVSSFYYIPHDFVYFFVINFAWLCLFSHCRPFEFVCALVASFYFSLKPADESSITIVHFTWQELFTFSSTILRLHALLNEFWRGIRAL